MMHSAQANYHRLDAFRIDDRGGSSSSYVLEIAPISIDGRFGDFWAEAKAWTCASRYDVQIQNSVLFTQAVSRSRVWRENLFLAADISTPNRAIFATVRSVLQSIEHFGAGSVDLTSVDLLSSHPKHLIAVLRATYAWRNAVPGWIEAAEVAPEVLTAHGINATRELAGLLTK